MALIIVYLGGLWVHTVPWYARKKLDDVLHRCSPLEALLEYLPEAVYSAHGSIVQNCGDFMCTRTVSVCCMNEALGITFLF